MTRKLAVGDDSPPWPMSFSGLLRAIDMAPGLVLMRLFETDRVDEKPISSKSKFVFSEMAFKKSAHKALVAINLSIGLSFRLLHMHLFFVIFVCG